MIPQQCIRDDYAAAGQSLLEVRLRLVAAQREVDRLNEEQRRYCEERRALATLLRVCWDAAFEDNPETPDSPF